jgi:hypothetical protein
MYLTNGIYLDTYATLDGDCTMIAEARGPETQLELGPTNSRLNVVLNDDGLGKLHRLLGEVIQRRTAQPDVTDLDFRVRG